MMLGYVKQFWNEVAGQIGKHGRSLLLIFIPLGFFLLVLTLQRDVPLHDLMADTASIADIPVYIGVVSNLGIVMWGAAFTICVFAAALLRGRSQWFTFFAASALLTLLLLLDDMFMLHDRVLPDAGIPEVVYVALYGLIALLYTVWCWRFIRETDYALLLLALCLLGFSVVLDVTGEPIRQLYLSVRGAILQPDGASPVMDDLVVNVAGDDMAEEQQGLGLVPQGNLSQLAEDGSKFLGIAAWLMYFSTTARRRILRSAGKLAVDPAA